jgi:Integrase core domain
MLFLWVCRIPRPTAHAETAWPSASHISIHNPGATLAFDRLFAFLVLGHGRRQLLWFEVTRHPTAEWLARQITEVFPWASAPTYLVRDNDRAYGHVFTSRLRAMGIRDRPIAPASPWQNGHAERLIGTVRRECLDRM